MGFNSAFKGLNTLHVSANSHMFRHEVCFMICVSMYFYLLHFVCQYTECTKMHDMHKIKFSKHVLSLDGS